MSKASISDSVVGTEITRNVTSIFDIQLNRIRQDSQVSERTVERVTDRKFNLVNYFLKFHAFHSLSGHSWVWFIAMAGENSMFCLSLLSQTICMCSVTGMCTSVQPWGFWHHSVEKSQLLVQQIRQTCNFYLVSSREAFCSFLFSCLSFLLHLPSPRRLFMSFCRHSDGTEKKHTNEQR